MAIDNIKKIISVDDARIKGVLTRFDTMIEEADKLFDSIYSIGGHKALVIENTDLCDIALKDIDERIGDFSNKSKSVMDAIKSAVEDQRQKEIKYFMNLLSQKKSELESINSRYYIAQREYNYYRTQALASEEGVIKPIRDGLQSKIDAIKHEKTLKEAEIRAIEYKLSAAGVLC
ncbi:MAG: hypothetical protein J6B89_03015 [Bacilli bacterium]|nr:hypothetical protein [Bacilli bacterium]